MNIWLPLFSIIAAAIGGFIGTWIRLNSERSKHLFNHKMTIYIKLIESYRNVIISKSNQESRQKYVSSQEQVKLIANREVIMISKKFYNASPEDQPQLMEQLIDAMRKDFQSIRKF